MSPHGYTEDASVEQPSLALLSELGWSTANLYNEWASGISTEGRETEHDVVLVVRLRKALERLNPSVPADCVDQAVQVLAADRSKLLPINANQELYAYLKSGVKVTIPDGRGGEEVTTVRVIDWDNPETNDFFVASQFWVAGDMYRRRSDLVGFVNGIPLVLYELKASHEHLKQAYDGNLTDYRDAIPQLLIPNAFIVLSNGSHTRLGSTFAPWEHFFEWKKINDEGEKGVISLETAIRGTCEKARLLDLIENFIIFQEVSGGSIKILAKNHQYLGVNQAIKGLANIGHNESRLGVFWHTQGSGKSLSMVFFTQKVHRKIRGNWTFVVVTDRQELDRQIYKTFAATGAVTEAEAHADSGQHLKQLLQEDHRYVFTLIQKFRIEAGKVYPKLSDRKDIIVLTDEAHRSQYDVFALNMRNALPEASFIGFTGTPLMAGEEKTREVFGDYVSIYDFADSIADEATVPLYYENRIPELQLTNEDLNEDLEELLENAELDEAQERKLEREFGRQYHLITRDDRLEAIAEDLVQHFLGRGYRGKAMMICIDKATAVAMYDKVQARWKKLYVELQFKHAESSDSEEKEAIYRTLAEMERTDMAVVVSQSQNEARDLKEKGLDIIPHRKRLVEENLDEKFKDPDDPLRLVFVCAMWITGFDVPSCSTIYLDKPMRNHTLMQTIARANRKFAGKQAGLIVDYVGVFRNLQKALAIYGSPKGGDSPIKDKAELVAHLEILLKKLEEDLAEKGIGTKEIKAAEGFQRIARLDDAVEILIETEDTKKDFLHNVGVVTRIYRAILPDPIVNQIAPDVTLLSVLAKKIHSLTPPPDISEVMRDVEDLLDDSIAARGYRLPPTEADPDQVVDLSHVDFEKLQERFNKARKRTEAEKLKALIEQKLQKMVRQNKSRTDFLEKFQKMIDEYNSGSKNIQELFEDLITFAQDLREEEKRAVSAGLSEEELAIFDILTQPEPKLTKRQEQAAKNTCRELLEKLKAERLVLDWRSRQQARAAVRLTIEKVLDDLPEIYTPEIYQQKCERTYRHVYDSYFGERASVYV